eukprot:Protomagalhaensia_wolfi_Nauph_80__2790@NODE_2904_length_951_cov_1611_750000_g2278_i0_p1_GENE_NODE_2904_length_951_cov_1611_750000_g2278_i0NODE_2904_length_951_cov_1611_750000_g2278_i0_p1_ORF_typecomplete_len188_score32_30Mlf1IP/PF10248_9/3_7e13_NODE_2904_length_951_cov_1611_750000_g2278_i0323886
MFFSRRTDSSADGGGASRASSRGSSLAPRDETSDLLSSWFNPSAMVQSFFGRRRLFDNDSFYGGNSMMDHFMSDDFASFQQSQDQHRFPRHGQYHSQMMFTSTEIGPDGQPKTQRYLEQSHGDADKSIHQMRQAFSDSTQGIDRYALERHIGDKGRRVVRERNRQSGNENQTDTIKGLNESKRTGVV